MVLAKTKTILSKRGNVAFCPPLEVSGSVKQEKDTLPHFSFPVLGDSLGWTSDKQERFEGKP